MLRATDKYKKDLKIEIDRSRIQLSKPVKSNISFSVDPGIDEEEEIKNLHKGLMRAWPFDNGE